eukprot:TRINITY_DN18624_c0_g1_i1.p1 TRINITY_DN18624_c0_g1~~TRINITY_DN18624_c0_g1_i1.p1  ORF type:complete len:310 (+),score=46.78 TRINITY_DN18624_c0_g1_i1:360-1289(+)
MATLLRKDPTFARVPSFSSNPTGGFFEKPKKEEEKPEKPQKRHFFKQYDTELLALTEDATTSTDPVQAAKVALQRAKKKPFQPGFVASTFQADGIAAVSFGRTSRYAKSNSSLGGIYAPPQGYHGFYEVDKYTSIAQQCADSPLNYSAAYSTSPRFATPESYLANQYQFPCMRSATRDIGPGHYEEDYDMKLHLESKAYRGKGKGKGGEDVEVKEEPETARGRGRARRGRGVKLPRLSASFMSKTPQSSYIHAEQRRARESLGPGAYDFKEIKTEPTGAVSSFRNKLPRFGPTKLKGTFRGAMFAPAET